MLHTLCLATTKGYYHSLMKYPLLQLPPCMHDSVTMYDSYHCRLSIAVSSGCCPVALVTH
jgi:hypothetical protein